MRHLLSEILPNVLVCGHQHVTASGHVFAIWGTGIKYDLAILVAQVVRVLTDHINPILYESVLKDDEIDLLIAVLIGDDGPQDRVRVNLCLVKHQFQVLIFKLFYEGVNLDVVLGPLPGISPCLALIEDELDIIRLLLVLHPT